MIPFTFFNLPNTTSNFSLIPILAVIALALFCTAIAYLLYFYLIENVGPNKNTKCYFLNSSFRNDLGCSNT
ncbi:EamA family transporter [Gottfriedia sp. OAE603]|uniref:EamA family transporter n=1 Tax=Gottfriedia sp. OAE603 TaxID=2663872 RepID=UPI00366BDE17